MKPMVLVVDDDLTIRNLIAEDLPGHGFQVTTISSCAGAKSLLKERAFHIILLDYRLPDESGEHFFESLKKEHPGIPVIFITNYPDVSKAVELMREGACDYILKPFTIPELARRVHWVLQQSSRQPSGNSPAQRPLPMVVEELMGNSEAIVKVRKTVEDLATAPEVPVFIIGETGTGKEVVARMIHQKTRGDTLPFVEVACSTIPAESFVDALFGGDSEGLLEKGRKGTLYLDHITEANPEVQAGLLRVLETRRFQRKGSAEEWSLESRVIATSNGDVQEMIQQGRFRKDLYYRLAGCEIHLPPLRDRRGDIALLAEHFFKEAVQRLDRKASGLSSHFLRRLMDHSFPGNVRELKNLVEQAVLQTRKGEADLPGFPLPDEGKGSGSMLAADTVTLQQGERQLIESAMKKFHGNKSAAARHLGISRPSLLRRIAKSKVG